MECAYLRYIQFRIVTNSLVTQTLLQVSKKGKSESDSCLYCKEIDTHEHELLYCPSFNSGIMWMNEKRYLISLQEIKCLAIPSHPSL